MKKLCFVFCVFLFKINYSQEQQLNETQIIGSHNSYKLAMDPELWNYLDSIHPELANSLQYEHIALTQQLDLGLRNLEFDVYDDPNGGHYYNPLGLEIVRKKGGTPKPFANEALKKRGFKLMHIQDIDFRSHHILFEDALREIVKWSEKNPGHHPVFITMNPYDTKRPILRDPLPFTKNSFERLDAIIRKILGKKLISPDDVRKPNLSLEASILKYGWGNVSKYKGKFLFILDVWSPHTKHAKMYLKGNENLEGRVFFINSEEGNPSAAIRVINDPISSYDYIKKLVKKGYLVRTRADANTIEARNNDYKRLQKAISSGAQIISTDYYLPSKLFSSSYVVNPKIITQNKSKSLKNAQSK